MAELADVAEVPISYLSQIERGQLVPKDEWLAGLERAYGVNVVEFYETWATTTNGDRMLVALAEEEK